MLSLLLKVPFVSNILISLYSERVFRKLVNASFFVFGDLFILQRFLPFQYGKTYTKGKAYLRLEIPDKIAFLLVHSSCPIIFLYSYFFFYANSNQSQFNSNYMNEVNYIYKSNNENFLQSPNKDKADLIDDVKNDQNDDIKKKDEYINSNLKNDDKKSTYNLNNDFENEKTENKDQTKDIAQLITFKSFMKAFISMPSILYLIHYSHRVLVYPWFRSKHSRPWPLESVIFFSLSNILSGLILSWSLFFKYRRFPILVQVILSILFLALIFLSSFHDYYLCSLRQAGESGYRIPKGICFNWVSCPHYTFELAAWFVFGFFLRGNLKERYLFWLIEFVNLSIRATSSTIAYRKMFNLKYPARSNPILPIFYSPV